MIKTQAQYNYDFEEQMVAIKSKSTEYIWKCWEMFSRKLEMPMYLDVEIEFILRYFHPNDITYLMHWYYSLGEFIRFTIAYYLYDVESLEKDREKYLSMASEPELKWFNENYADKAPLLQVIYIRLIYEIENRKNRGLHGSNKAAEGLLTAIQKLAVKAKVSPEEFFAKKIYPILANIRNRRIRRFYRLYTGKKLKK